MRGQVSPVRKRLVAAMSHVTLAVSQVTAQNSGTIDPVLAKQGYEFLKTYCYRCHGIDFKAPRLNVLDRDILTSKPSDPEEKPFITLGKPDDSELWQRVAISKDMPPEDAPARPSNAENDIFRRWILEGAPFPARATREFISEKSAQQSILSHLRKTPAVDRPYQRYYTLTNLHNNRQVNDDELRLYRAALSKLINSLSWKKGLVLPTDIDGRQVLYAINLRDVGWDKNDLWRKVLEVYPYGLKFEQSPADPELNATASEIYQLAETDLPALRADWFISFASRPPLYHTLLTLPTSARPLEDMLGVDVETDFLKDRLARAGFATSGVSGQNRLVDRHVATNGAYWKSYDFKSNEGPHNIFHFPLGPEFRENPFPAQAFQHDGGEIIFNLPNGLQGYLLVDGKGNRIDSGPIEVVSDALKTSGTPAIVNGLSCMACHKHGTIEFKDTLGEGLALFGRPRRKAERLIPKPSEMDRLLAQDHERFCQALETVTGPFLKTGADQSKRIEEFPEPIGAIARLYLKDLGPEEIASELGMESVEELKKSIKLNPKLRELGLAPLLNDNTIKRDVWHSLESFLSLFHRVSNELEIGTPHRTF